MSLYLGTSRVKCPNIGLVFRVLIVFRTNYSLSRLTSEDLHLSVTKLTMNDVGQARLNLNVVGDRTRLDLLLVFVFRVSEPRMGRRTWRYHWSRPCNLIHITIHDLEY